MRRSFLIFRSLVLRTAIGGMLFVGLFFSNSEGIRLLPFATDSEMSSSVSESRWVSTASSETRSNYNFSVRELSSKRPKTAGKDNRDSTPHSPSVTVTADQQHVARPLNPHKVTLAFYQQPTVELTGTHPAISGRSPPTFFV